MVKVAFLQTIEYEYLGVAMLSAVLKKAHHHTKLFFMFEKTLIKDLSRFQPDIICFAVMTGQHEEPLGIIKEIKKKNINSLIIFGGPHPTYFPKIIEEEGVDIIIKGEAEKSLLEIANRLDKNEDIKNIPNMILKHNEKIIENPMGDLIEDLDSLPLPDRELYYEKSSYLKNNPHKAFILSRGCPYPCTFCFEPTYTKLVKNKGRIFRQYSVERSIKEIKDVIDRYDTKTVRFSDDVFTLNQPWTQEFCKKYAEEINLPFYCITRADCLNEETVKMLKLANCRALYFGIESGNNHIRNNILKKNLSEKSIFSAASLLHKYNIKFGTFNILGSPGETIGNAFETIDINIKIKTTYPYSTMVQPYPQTGLYEYARENNFLKKDFSFNDIDTSYFHTTVLENQYAKELENIHKFFWLVVKFPILKPVIKQLIRLPTNNVYDFIFKITFGVRYMVSSGTPFLRMILLSRKMSKYFSKN